MVCFWIVTFRSAVSLITLSNEFGTRFTSFWVTLWCYSFRYALLRCPTPNHINNHHINQPAQADLRPDAEVHDNDRGDNGGKGGDAENAGTVLTLPPSLHRNIGDNANQSGGHFASVFCIEEEGRHTESIGRLHGLPGTPGADWIKYQLWIVSGIRKHGLWMGFHDI